MYICTCTTYVGNCDACSHCVNTAMLVSALEGTAVDTLQEILADEKQSRGEQVRAYKIKSLVVVHKQNNRALELRG